jgi:hypothetical protein
MLVHAVHPPIVRFVDDALAGDRSITVHAFVSQQHGNDSRVRLAAASLTVIALGCLLVGEALAVAAFLKPMLPGRTATASTIAAGTVLLAAVPALAAGKSGGLHFTQLLLGMLYLGVFGSLALLVYQLVSALAPLAPRGILGIVVIVATSAVLLYYRRSRYVDTTPIGGAWPLARIEKVLNVCISVALGLLVAVGLMALLAARAPTDAFTASGGGTRLPLTALVALSLAPLVYPLVDVASWQRLAALGKAGQQPLVLRSVFRVVGFESALLWLFLGAFGAVAVTGVETPAGDGVQALLAKLASEESGLATLVLSLLAIAILAAALSAMSAQFLACLGTIRHDLLRGSIQRNARLDGVAVGALAVACGTAFVWIDAFVTIRFADGTFIACLFAIACAQLATAPLVLGPIAWPRHGAVTPGWALGILCAAAASALAVVALYLASGNQAWLWAAVPACLGSGFGLYAIALRR